MPESAPVWMLPVTLDRWPVTPRMRSDLRYRIDLPTAWADTPRVSTEGSATAHWYDGRSPAEWARIGFLPDADRTSNLASWVAASIALSQFPIPIPALLPRPRLLAWDREEMSPTAARRFGADSTIGHVGLASVLENDWTWLVRLYSLLVRRESIAWHVMLAFETACPPGMDQEMVAFNDHRRAGATFGSLQLT